MAVWSVLLLGPVLLPVAFLLRSDLSPLIAEGLLLLGVVGLFLSICAADSIGTGARRESEPNG